MSTGTIHTLADDLYLIEGHHPHTMWDDPDLPTIAVYRAGRRLYLLDTGAGPEQREAIHSLARRYHDVVDEVVLLNSHGHVERCSAQPRADLGRRGESGSVCGECRPGCGAQAQVSPAVTAELA
jgi:hypothetical protein